MTQDGDGSWKESRGVTPRERPGVAISDRAGVLVRGSLSGGGYLWART